MKRTAVALTLLLFFEGYRSLDTIKHAAVRTTVAAIMWVPSRAPLTQSSVARPAAQSHRRRFVRRCYRVARVREASGRREA